MDPTIRGKLGQQVHGELTNAMKVYNPYSDPYDKAIQKRSRTNSSFFSALNAAQTGQIDTAIAILKKSASVHPQDKLLLGKLPFPKW
jgi:hypothetical protein